MKKYATIVIILILVTLAHIFFIKPLISEKTEKKAETPASQPAENVEQTSVKKEPARNLFKHPSPNPLFGKFYDYRKAVWDDNLSVPGGKQAKSGILVDLDTHMVLWAKKIRARAAQLHQ